MPSFEKKIKSFLNSAAEQEVIDEPTASKLLAYANSEDYEHKGWFSLSKAMGSIGAIALAFGVILIIATNWHNINDITKIISFIILLGGSHFLALKLYDKGYEKTSSSLHFLGAALFIAGIGLIAQIFNLSSKSGESFLIWTLAISPLAVLLKSGSIALLSVLAFLIWGNVYIDYLDGMSSWIVGITFTATVLLLCVLSGEILKKYENEISPYLKIPGILGLFSFLYFFGFSHNFRPQTFEGNDTTIMLPLILIILSTIMLVYLWLQNKANKDIRYWLIAMGCSVSTLTLVVYTIYSSVDPMSFQEKFHFGWNKKVYFLPMMISIIAWISYFILAFWGVIYGALHHKRALLNFSVVLIGIGIFTRFLDLMGSMMDTGMLFIACGLVFFLLGSALEKWRRKLIKNTKA